MEWFRRHLSGRLRILALPANPPSRALGSAPISPPRALRARERCRSNTERLRSLLGIPSGHRRGVASHHACISITCLTRQRAAGLAGRDARRLRIHGTSIAVARRGWPISENAPGRSPPSQSIALPVGTSSSNADPYRSIKRDRIAPSGHILPSTSSPTDEAPVLRRSDHAPFAAIRVALLSRRRRRPGQARSGRSPTERSSVAFITVCSLSCASAAWRSTWARGCLRRRLSGRLQTRESGRTRASPRIVDSRMRRRSPRENRGARSRLAPCQPQRAHSIEASGELVEGTKEFMWRL